MWPVLVRLLVTKLLKLNFIVSIILRQVLNMYVVLDGVALL